MRKFAVLILLLASLLPASSRASATTVSASALSPAAVLYWNTIAVTAVRNAGKFQPEGFVYMAYVQAAVYDAVVKIEGGYVPYHDFLIDPSTAVEANPDAAVAAAAYWTLLHYVPSQASAIQSAYDTYVSLHPEAGQAAGAFVGMSAANDIIELRMNDGLNAPSDPTLGHGPLEPGVWQLAIPTATAQTPWLATMKPFMIESASQFRSDPPPAPSSAEYAGEVNETKAYGAKNSTVRMPEQTATAYFWHGNVINQYNQALRDLATEHGFDLVQTARALAMGAIIGADAFIGCWDAKYHYLFWRPFTAIQHADIDGNAATDPDPTWASLLNTPGHPEYPSAHGCITAAVVEVFSALLGTNKVGVTIWGGENGSQALTTSRYFEKANDINKEVVDARVWIGFHLRGSVVAGVVLGRKTAHWALQRYFLPTN